MLMSSMVKYDVSINIPSKNNFLVTKGQLISKGLFDVIFWTKKLTIFFKEFLS